MKHSWRVLFLLFSLVACVHGQTTSAAIGGAILDPSGRAIPGAEVDVLNAATGVISTSQSGASGLYSIAFLPPGQYRIQISKPGFKTITTFDVTLNVQSALTLNFTLPVGAMSESITVEAGAPLLNTTDASVSTVIDRKFVENMPLNGRSFQDLVSMTPGVVTQSSQAVGAVGMQGDFSVNGQRAESNYYTLDGVSANVGSGYPNGYAQPANGGSIAATTALGTTQSLISVDALQEFRVSSSTYSAEYGRSPGGQFSFASRSGTSTFHGTIYDYLRNDVFDANDWFNDYNHVRKTALRQNNFGGTFGGPVFLPKIYENKERTFFFFSYEGLRLVQPTAATTQYVPAASVRTDTVSALKPIFNAFPLPSGDEIRIPCSSTLCPVGSPAGTLVPSGLSPFIKAYSLPSQINSTSVRLDHHLSEKLALFFRWSGTPTFTRSRELSSAITLHYNTSTYTFGATSQLSRTFGNEFRVGYADSNATNHVALDDFGGAVPIALRAAFGVGAFPTSEPFPYITIAGVGTSSIYNYDAGTRLHQWNITDNVSFTANHHFLRFGVDYRHLVSPLDKTPLYVSPTYSTRQSMVTNIAGLSTIKYNSAIPIFQQFSLYAQEEWHVRPDLVISGGLRWDVNPPPREANGKDAYTVLGDINNPATLFLAPRGTPLWKTTWFNFAPRLGVAWTVRNQPGQETVLRAGGGVFFDTGTQNATRGFNGLGFFASRTYPNASLPITPDQLNFSTAVTAPYTNVIAFPSHLQLPYTLEWSASVEQSLGKAQALTVSYVASIGRRLLQQQYHSIGAINPNLGIVYFYPTGLTSSYQSLQLKFQRSVSHGLQTLASYTWAHSLDYGSTDASYSLAYGNSDFDVRHNFQAGLSWEMPRFPKTGVAAILLNHWAIDGRVLARTAFPITLLGNTLSDSLGNRYYSGVNYDPSKPVYLYGAQYPGGRALNGGRFAIDPALTTPIGKAAGNAPRNFVRAFSAWQINTALRREIRFHESVTLQFRAEAFNILNHPNFGYVDPVLSDAQFGTATKMLNQSLGSMSALYQQGGARSFQFALKAMF